MSRALTHRLRRLEAHWALQMARRLEMLPPLVLLAALLDCEPEQLPSPEDYEAEPPDEAWERLVEHARQRTPQERTQARAQSLLTDYNSPCNQRLRRALTQYEAHPQAHSKEYVTC